MCTTNVHLMLKIKGKHAHAHTHTHGPRSYWFADYGHLLVREKHAIVTNQNNRPSAKSSKRDPEAGIHNITVQSESGSWVFPAYLPASFLYVHVFMWL